MLDARTITITVACPLDRAYAFAHQPENFPKWAAGLSGSLHREGERWMADAPQGQAEIRFSPPNDYGVLDHRVILPDAPEIYIPLRLIANGEGVDILFTLFRQPGMDEAAWDQDEATVRADLAKLKALLEEK